MTQPTSYEAHGQIQPTAKTLRQKVLMFLAARGPYGATDEEMQNALGMNPSTQRPRRKELQEARLVRDSGETRKTRSGRRAIVWVTTEKQGTLF